MKTSSLLKNLFARLPSGGQAAIKDFLDGRAMRFRHEAAWRQLVRTAGDLSDRCLEDVRTLEDWTRQRAVSRRQLQSMLGLDPWPERSPLQARIAGTIERPAYRIEKLVFESLPDLWVTANFYLPRGGSGPRPGIVYLNGHWPSLDGAKTGYQDRYLWYPANGFALLVLDPLGFGEIPGVHAGMNRLNRWDWLSRGYTPAGVEVWNAMRAMDWLESRPEIDASRIGATGISGGGVMTQYWAALDERVAVAAPSCSTYTLGTQVALGLVPQQCDCTFYPNVFGMDFPEVLALIAPRPLMILGGRKDPIFPPAGFRAAFRRVRRIYGLFDAAGPAEPRIRLVESGHGHTDPPRSLSETRRWMCRWLRSEAASRSATAGASPPPEPPATLRCVEVLPRSARNYRISDEWGARPAPVAPVSRAEAARRQAQILAHLRTSVFGWFPTAAIPFRTRRLAASGGYAGAFAEYGEYEFDSEPGVPVKVCLLKPRGKPAPVPLVLWVKGPAERVAFPDVDEYFPLLRSHAVLAVTPRLAERPLAPSEYAHIERTAALTGRSVAAMRTWDVLRAAAWATCAGGLHLSGLAVYGRGEAGIAGLYAALLDSAFGHVILRDPPSSHYAGPALPAILRETDIEEAAGTLAPRRLTLVARGEREWDVARSFYEMLGRPNAFGHAASLPEAVFRGEAEPDAGAAGEQPC